MTTSSLVGSAITGKSSMRHCLGSGLFVDDIKLDRMLYCIFLRSNVAHGYVKNLDLSNVPKECIVLKASDIDRYVKPYEIRIPLPGVKPLYMRYLAGEKVRYVGEPIAAVLSSDRYLLEDALEAIDIEYDPLPVVVDAEESLSEGATLLYEEWGDNSVARLSIKFGHVNEVIERAEYVLREKFRISRSTPSPMEPRACIASYNNSTGSLEVWSSNQAPHIHREMLAEALGLPGGRVRVIAPDVGGAFGLKCLLFPEDIVVCVASMITGRPVKWVESRMENLTASAHAREQIHEVEVGARRDGEILALRDRIITDIGASVLYPHSSIGTSIVTASMLPGPYRFQNYEFEINCVVTNKCPFGAYRGFGQPEATFVMERVIEVMAEELSLDPVEVRIRNMVREEELPFISVTGTLIDSGSPLTTLRKALELARYEELRRWQKREAEAGRLIGIGIGCNTETTVPSLSFQTGRWGASEAATVKVSPDGDVIASIGAASIGTSIDVAIAQIVGDELGILADNVNVILGDTASTPFSTGLWGSRGAVMMGVAARKAAKNVREKIVKIAARLLDVRPEDILISGGLASVKNDPERVISIREIARVAYNFPSELPDDASPGLESTEFFEAPNISKRPDEKGRVNVSGATTNAVHIAVVEVDQETGAIKPLKYYVVHDSGILINPAIVEGQVIGGVVQSLGQVTLEELRYSENGQLLNNTFSDYLLPGPMDIPEVMSIDHVASPARYIPSGFKGAGESGTIATLAAMSNAVEDALRLAGIKRRITTTHLSTHELWRMIETL